MVQEHTEGYRNMQAYLRGWKHGAGAAARLHPGGPYHEGYEAGLKARIKVQVEAQKLYAVTDDEIQRGILR